MRARRAFTNSSVRPLGRPALRGVAASAVGSWLLLALVLAACPSGPVALDASDTSDVADDGAKDAADTVDTGPLGPTWQVEVGDGGLDWTETTATELITYARRTHALGVQAVLAANALVYLDAAKTPRDTATARLEAVRAAADLASTAAEALMASTAAARAAAKADDPGAAPHAEGPAPLTLARRDEVVLDTLDMLAVAVAAEAARLRTAADGIGVLLPLEPADIQAALDAARAALAQGPAVVLALPGGVVASGRASGPGPGFMTRGLVTVAGAEAAAAEAGEVMVLSGGGSLPLAGGPAGGAVLLRRDSGAGALWDVPLWLAPVSADEPSAVELHVSLTAADAATVVSTPLLAGAPCQASGGACALDPGAFPPGDYLGPGGLAFASAGLGGTVVDLLQRAVPPHEWAVDLGTAGPPPLLTKLAPERGPVGTGIVLTGSGFGTDPGRVTISMSHGRLLHPEPGSVSDTQVTFTVPSGHVPGLSYGYCAWGGEQAGLTWLTVGGIETGGLYFTLTGLPACPPLPFGAQPAGGLPGVEVRVEGYGFSPTPELNRVQIGSATVEAESYEPDTFLEEHRGTIRFRIPADMGPGTVALRFRRLDGVDAWSSSVNFTVLSEDLVTLGPGELAGGVISPGRCWDVGLESQGCVGAPMDWVLSGTNLHAIVSEGSKRIGHLEALVDTPAGSFKAYAYAPTPDTLVVREVQAEWFAGVGVGQNVAIRVRGREPTTYADVISQPLTVPVVGAITPGGWRLLTSGLDNDPTVGPMVKVPRGDVLVLVGQQVAEIQELVAPGLWPGTLRVTGSCWQVQGLCTDLQKAGTPRARHVLLGAEGTYTISNLTTGKSVDVEVLGEGFYGASVWPSISIPADEGPQPQAADAASAGVVLGCGGARLDIAPGALPLHGGSGAYRVGCATAYTEVGAGLPQFNDGQWERHVWFEPEPDKLLKPIRFTLPFGEAGRTTEPDAALVDGSSGLYFTLPATVDAAAGELHIEVPAGSWPPAGAAPGAGALFALAPTGPAQASKWPSLGLNKLLGRLKAVSWSSPKGTLTDALRKLQVDWVTEPGATGYVSNAFADEVMATAQATWDMLTGHQWPKPDGWFGGWLKITIADLGPAAEVKGSTTSGVFGQPWIKINSQLAMGGPLKTTVAHEMGHGFQRQLTTNLVLNWIDEASAGWVAQATLGSEAELAADITPESEFPAVSLPGTFNSGYTQDQGYAAGAWAIWLEDAYPGSLLKIYQELAGDPVAWVTGHATLKKATGVATVGTLVREFALAYWGQTYAPVNALSLVMPAHTAKWQAWSGVAVSESRPPLSSQRFDVAVADAFGPTLHGHDVVVRLQGPKGQAELWLWGDAKPCAAPADGLAMTELAVLGSLSLGHNLGAWQSGTYKCLRVLLINSSASATVPGSARLCAPHITGLSPASGALSGGYPVTVSGSCFGPQEGSASVAVGGFAASVMSWTDTAITVTMINAGGSAGTWPVSVTTTEGAQAQPADFTFAP